MAMNLKSMLNDSFPHETPTTPTHPIPQQTPKQPYSVSHSSEVQHSGYARPYRDRPPSHPPPLQLPDSRSPSTASASGSYFPTQSPYQDVSTSTPTLSASSHSIYNQSPGPHVLPFTPRDGYTTHPQPNGSSSVASPTVAPPHPSTPGSQIPYQNHRPSSSHTTAQPPLFSNQSYHHTRETSIPAAATPHSLQHQISPDAHFIPQPATPLGPLGQFQRPSPQSSRAISHATRTVSLGSAGSGAGHEFYQRRMVSPDHQRREILHRRSSMDRERERSISVSPKTIPLPTPPRPVSGGREVPPRPDIPLPSTDNSMPMLAFENQRQLSTPLSASATPKEQYPPSLSSSTKPSPAPSNAQFPTPPSQREPQPEKSGIDQLKQTSLKRNASFISGADVSPQPKRKRLKRDEIPLFARSARPNRPPRLSQGSGPPVKQPRLANRPTPVNGQNITPAPAAPLTIESQETPAWEASIMGVSPYQDLTRKVCDWIVQNIGMAVPPSGGSVFEIEAKVGEIHDIKDDGRINLPIDTEALFSKNKFRATKFKSSMTFAQHKKINDFLNDQTTTSLSQPRRQPIFFDHPLEYDEFFELNPAGVDELPPRIHTFRDKRHKVKVRKTFDLKNNKMKAQIIKLRIADIEIYNPSSDFDYRISISIESPWDGNPAHLVPSMEGGGERSKDRMSYRHLAYQIDLTQVSYAGKVEKEHELEVEISTEQVRKELDNLRAGRPNKYEELIQGFLDNVRLLCRKATLQHPPRH